MCDCDCAVRLERLERYVRMKESASSMYVDKIRGTFGQWCADNPDHSHRDRLHYLMRLMSVTFAQAKMFYLVHFEMED